MRRGRARGLLLVSLAVAGCDDERARTGAADGVLIVAPDRTDDAGERMIAISKHYLETMLDEGEVQVQRIDPGAFDDVRSAAASRRAGLVLVMEADRLAPDRIEPDRVFELHESGFVLETVDDGSWKNRLDGEGATFVLMAGKTPLARQYATYELLRRTGVRFFHPEEEYVPALDGPTLRTRARRPTALHREGMDYEPDYAWRSWSFHGSHPLEHLEAFSDADHPIDEAVRVEDWIVKNFGNRFKGPGRGVATGEAREERVRELDELRREMGFPTGVGITLHNEQQGSTAEIDPDSDVPVREQIEALVAQKLAEVPDARWFSIHFGPTEFTVTPDEETVQWIDWAGQAAKAIKPGIEVEINVHITGSQPTPNYDDLGCPNGTNDSGRSDYYDLAFHTDPRLGASVHTVMFYPLEGPARVYNQRTFEHKLCLMQRASARGRPLTWFPEGSWWLSFDNSIPVYLPLYIWARWRDIDLLRPLLASRGTGTLRGHRMFNSGQEWGYWQQDYAVGLLAWNTDIPLQAVLGEIFDPLCEPTELDGCDARSEAIEVLEDVMEHQRQLFLNQKDWQGRPGGLYAYFAGEDQADEIAAASGLEFRPVRVSFGTVAGWGSEALDHFESTDLALLEASAERHATFVARLQAVRSMSAPAGLPWIDEVIDGVEIDHLRALQAARLYRAVIAYRRATLEASPDPRAAAQPHLDAAAEILVAAEAVIRRREAAYRYPAAQTYGGGLTPQTAVPNGTTYPYRVHTKTHLLTYWHNRHDQVRKLLDGEDLADAQTVQLAEALADPGAVLTVTWPEADALGGHVEVGPHVLEPGDASLDLGDDEGWWSVSGELMVDDRSIDVIGGVARTANRAVTPAQGIMLLEPANPTAQGVLGSVFPSLQWGVLSDPSALVVAPDADGDGSVLYTDLVRAREVSRVGDVITTEPVMLGIPVATTSGGQPLKVGLSDTVITATVTPEGLADPVLMEGRISVADLVLALQELAGFDEKGALQTLSGILGFDPDDPPSTVPFAAEIVVES